MPIPAKKIVRNTPTVVRNRTRSCSIRTKSPGKEISHPRFGRTLEQEFHVQCLDGVRTVTLRWVGPKKPGPQSEQDLGTPHDNTELWISCTCPFFLFYNEYALAKVDSSDILYSNGQPPVVRNPGEVPFVCKHGFMAIKESIKLWKTQSRLRKKFEKVKEAPQPTQRIRTPKKKIMPENVLEQISDDIRNASSKSKSLITESAKQHGGKVVADENGYLILEFQSSTRARYFSMSISELIPFEVSVSNNLVTVIF